MSIRLINRGRASGAILAAFLGPAALATDLTNNLAAGAAGVETASGARWLASSFTTDASGHTLHSVSLLMTGTQGAAASVAIYTSAGLEPGTLVATLSAPAAYPGELAVTTFTSPGVALAPSATYWVVLRPQSGVFTWAWTASNTGSGAGYTHTWGISEDSGAFWWSQDVYPTQMRVVVDQPACDADFNQDGNADQDDVSYLVNVIAGGGNPSGIDPDFNRDGNVDQDDTSALVNVIAGGSCP